MVKVIADYETGEILEELEDNESYAKIADGDMLIKKNSITYLKGTVSFANKYNFVKLNVTAIKDLSKYGSSIVLLFDKIGYESGILTHSNGKLIKPKSLAGLLKKSNRTGALIIKDLIDMEVLKKHRMGRTYYYTFNPWIATKGKRITRDLYDDFCMSRWANNLTYLKKDNDIDWSSWND